MSEDFISGLHADLVEAMDRYERCSPRGRLAAGRYPRLLRRATLARVAAGAALIVALVAVVVTVARESDVEREAAPPGKKLVATDVERGVRFSLDGRLLTVQLLPDRPEVLEAVSGAEISATCGANVAAPPGDPRSETTVFRLWPAGETNLSYRFPRDVRAGAGSSPVRRHRRVRELPRRVVGGEGADRRDSQQLGAGVCLHRAGLQRLHGPVRLQADRVPTGGRQAHRGLQSVVVTRLEHALGQGVGMRSTAARRSRESPSAATERPPRSGKTASEIDTVQLRRTATGEWLIDKLGEHGLTAELRRKLRGPGG